MYVFTFRVLNNPLNSIPALQVHTETERRVQRPFRQKGQAAERRLVMLDALSSHRKQWGKRTESRWEDMHGYVLRDDKHCPLFFYLPGIGWHPPGHHPLQVAAQAHALDSDDGLLGEDGAAEEWGVITDSSNTVCLQREHRIPLLSSHYLPGTISSAEW